MVRCRARGAERGWWSGTRDETPSYDLCLLVWSGLIAPPAAGLRLSTAGWPYGVPRAWWRSAFAITALPPSHAIEPVISLWHDWG